MPAAVLLTGLQPINTARLSLDSRLGPAASRVLLPQQPTTSVSSREHSPAVNPFDRARSGDSETSRLLKQGQLEVMVEEITTPGGSTREVIVQWNPEQLQQQQQSGEREASAESSSSASAMAFASEGSQGSPRRARVSGQIRTRSEELPSWVSDGADASGAVLEFQAEPLRSPLGSVGGGEQNPFAVARAGDAPAGRSGSSGVVKPAGTPRSRLSGSFGMAREDLLSRVGQEGATVFLDTIPSVGEETTGSSVRQSGPEGTVDDLAARLQGLQSIQEATGTLDDEVSSSCATSPRGSFSSMSTVSGVRATSFSAAPQQVRSVCPQPLLADPLVNACMNSPRTLLSVDLLRSL